MKGFERGNHQERNLAHDRELFSEALGAFAIDELPTEFDEAAAQALRDSLRNKKLFLLGETHGVRENVEVIYTLFKEFGFRQLALEWDPQLQKVVDRYLHSGDIDFDAIKDSPDGRITVGHFALLKKLKMEGLLDNLVCFDEGGATGWNDRDANMAKKILASVSGTPTLVVAGNLHTKIEAFPDGDNQTTHHPMGEQIKLQIPGVASGNIEYRRGQFYNYGVRDLLDRSEGREPLSAHFYKAEDERFIFEVPEATAAVVPNPHERL